MSVDDDERTRRQVLGELENAKSGQIGVPVDAVCVECKTVRINRVSVDSEKDPANLDTRDLSSFKHVCHGCQTATWWNPVAVLSGLVASEGDNE